MTLSNPKQYYSRFLKGHEGKLHFAAHSHHFWPDVSRDAHMAYWDHCATQSDQKWDSIFLNGLLFCQMTGLTIKDCENLFWLVLI